jgi:hypothetical protein
MKAIKVKYYEEPVYHKANSTGHVQLDKDWMFSIDNRNIWVPKDYVCDGASIPRGFWFFVGSPFDPINIVGAWAHDYLYLTHLVNRETADEVGFQIWRQAGMGLGKARIMWSAVRSCASFAWKNSAEDNIELIKLRAMIASRPDAGKFDKV